MDGKGWVLIVEPDGCRCAVLESALILGIRVLSVLVAEVVKTFKGSEKLEFDL